MHGGIFQQDLPSGGEDAINAMRPQPLRLASELDQVAAPGIPFRAAAPGEIEIGTFLSSAAVADAVAIVGLQHIRLLGDRELCGRSESPLEVADVGDVDGRVERVR